MVLVNNCCLCSTGNILFLASSMDFLLNYVRALKLPDIVNIPYIQINNLGLKVKKKRPEKTCLVKLSPLVPTGCVMPSLRLCTPPSDIVHMSSLHASEPNSAPPA